MTFKDYEILVAKIVEGLAKLDGLKSSKVRHDVELVGISGASHQIDVLWEFEVEPIKHKILFQAKDWNKNVDFVALNTFSGVLRDFPEARGVLVTKTGYDKGNIDKLARSYGINLLVLDESGKLAPSLAVERRAKVTEKKIQIRITNWAFQNEEESLLFQEHVNSVGKNLVFTNQSGKQFSYHVITEQIYRICSQNNWCENGKKVTYKPGEPLFLKISENRQIQVKGARATIFCSEEILGETSLLITHVLQSVLNDKTYYVDDSFKIHREGKIELDLHYKDPDNPGKMLTTTFTVIDNTLRKPSKDNS